MTHFVGLKTGATAKDVTKAFLFNVWKLHGHPKEIVSDHTLGFLENLNITLHVVRSEAKDVNGLPSTDRWTNRTSQSDT